MKVYIYYEYTDKKEYLGDIRDVPMPKAGDKVRGNTLRGTVSHVEYHYDIKKIFICV